MPLELHPGRLTLDVLQAIHAGGVELSLASAARAAIRAETARWSEVVRKQNIKPE